MFAAANVRNVISRIANCSSAGCAGFTNWGHFIGEMAVLEEKMQAISAAGRGLIERLVEPDEDNDGGRDESPA